MLTALVAGLLFPAVPVSNLMNHSLPGMVLSREMVASHRLLNFPVKSGAPKRQMTVLIEGEPPRRFEIELAEGKPDWWAFMDLGPDKGRKVVVQLEGAASEAALLDSLDQTDHVKDSASLYREKLRPQFHFTSMRGWLNDPNGLVFYKGEYHLFYQHNPYGWGWGNMHWGHAVSRDLVHWKELPIALYPDEHGTMYSGSAVVDWNNSAGFQRGSERPLISIFTAAGQPFTQGIAFSNDRGRTWNKYAGNPVVGHLAAENRDPKVFWYEPDQKWVMALYLDGSTFDLMSSKDLKSWTKMSQVTIEGTSECPNFFPMPLDGKKDQTKWVFYGGNGGYLVGSFDGTNFKPETARQEIQHGNCWYASQVYGDIPEKDGRTILVPWGTIEMPGMPFNQMMGLPVELQLRSTGEGPRIYAMPVRELAELRAREHDFSAQTLEPGVNPLGSYSGDLVDLNVEFAPGSAKQILISLRGLKIVYDTQHQTLSCLDRSQEIKPAHGKISLRFLIDRTSVDIFGNHGRLYMPMGTLLREENRSFELEAIGGTAQISLLKAYDMKSIWGP